MASSFPQIRRQNGSLIKTGTPGFEVWRGRYRVWRRDDTGKWKAMQKRTFVGKVSELSKHEAKKVLRAIILDETSRARMFANVKLLKKAAKSSDGAQYGSDHIQRGILSELAVALDLGRKGFEIFKGITGHSSCDLIALRQREIYRVEVKTGYVAENGGPVCNTDRNTGKFDILAVFCPDHVARYFNDQFVEICLDREPLSRTA